MSAQPDDDHQPWGEPNEGMVWLPMTEPLDPATCPCGTPTAGGFCAEHTGAVAFKVPVTADGNVLPAVDWLWAHEEPCPLGESQPIGSPPDADAPRARVWACPHRDHPQRKATTDSAGDDDLDAVCGWCGYEWAAPWSAATAPGETTPCPGCGRAGALTLFAAGATDRATDS